ncbi:MAG: heavy-metal-associated domain-containing protein [Thermodesulfobacteriota bacterium]
MAAQTLFVPNISCNHCVHTIKTELSEITGVRSVEGDVENQSVTVEYDDRTSLEKIKETLKEINYPAQ